MLREISIPAITVTTDADTIYSLLRNRAQTAPDESVAAYKAGPQGRWQYVSAKQMNEAVRAIAKGLMGLGVRKGDTIVVYSPTCYEWGLVDYASNAIGAITVPIYETDSPAQATALTREVDPKVAFCMGDDRAHTLEAVRSQDGNALGYVFNFLTGGIDAVKDFGDSIDDATLDAAIDQVDADDVATIVYTSGSTGKPKGVMLSSRNFLTVVKDSYDVLPIMCGARGTDPTRLLLFLPLAHCFARYIQYTMMGGNGVVGYVSDAHHLLADLREFKPTLLLGVPRVFEKVYNAASQKAGAGFKGRVFAKATKHFIRWDRDEQAGRIHTPWQMISHNFYQSAVGGSLRSALGPNLHWLACGGAPMNEDLAHFFNGLDDITFIQGYGMTETSAPCVVNTQALNKIGTVGCPGPGISARLADDDELEIKGGMTFLGYKDDPERTAEAFDDGWLRTGDLATIDDDGYITITGRKKNIIITAGGKNVSPEPMEKTIQSCPIVSQAVVIGDGKPFVSAIVTLDEGMLATWLESNGLEPMSLEQAAASPAVRAFVQQYVDQANASVSRAESVRKFEILSTDFTQEDGTLTPSLKVVRPAVLRKYATFIDTVLYAPKPSTIPAPFSAKILAATDKAGQIAQEKTDETIDALTPYIDQAKERLGQTADQVKDHMDQVKGRIADAQAAKQEGSAGVDTADTADTADATDAADVADVAAAAAADDVTTGENEDEGNDGAVEES
ncbi:MAG: AMP-dependent synthetase/ligase [Bifidobacteriaceae bacterium]|nr:AMP-dependent synthetase/ligase [Bifidobacteriaceae bacterium]